MESTIDPQEWKREIDRVEKLLEIPEYPEFMEGSQSESSHEKNTYIMNNFNNEDVVKKLSIFSSYFDKSLSNGQIILDSLQLTNENIGSDLKKIQNFENNLASMSYLKDNVSIYLFK